MQLSQIEQARRSTIFTKAQGRDLDSLASLYGIPRPSAFPPAYWDNVLLSIVYQAQGTYTQFFNALYWLMKPWTDQETKSEIIISSDGYLSFSGVHKGFCNKIVKVTCSSDSSVNGFYYVNRYIETGTPPLIVKRLRLNTSYDTPYFNKWTSTQDKTCTIEFLPFIIFEQDAQITIYLDSSLALTPPSYAQENAEERPSEQPYGSQVMVLWDSSYPDEPSYGNQTTGPFPLYMGGNDLSSVFINILKDIAPAGIKITILAQDWDAALDSNPLYIYAQTGAFPNLLI